MYIYIYYVIYIYIYNIYYVYMQDICIGLYNSWWYKVILLQTDISPNRLPARNNHEAAGATMGHPSTPRPSLLQVFPWPSSTWGGSDPIS